MVTGFLWVSPEMVSAHISVCIHMLPSTPTPLCPQVETHCLSLGDFTEQCTLETVPNSPHVNHCPRSPTPWGWKYIICSSSPTPEQADCPIFYDKQSNQIIIIVEFRSERGVFEPRVLCEKVAMWGGESRPNLGAWRLQDDGSMSERWGGASLHLAECQTG